MATSNFYKSVMHDVHIPFMPGRSQTSLMAVLQKQVYDRLCEMPLDTNSSFSVTMHARRRTFREEPKTTATHVLARIASLAHAHQIPDILRLLHENGCGVLFAPQYDPDLQQPERNIIYLRITDPVVARTDRPKRARHFIYKLFNLTHQQKPENDIIRTEKRLVDGMPELYQLQSSLCYNPLSEADLSGDLTWLKFYGLPGRFSTVSVDSVQYFESLGHLMHEMPLQDWRDYFTFRWLHFVSDFFQDTHVLTRRFLTVKRPKDDTCRAEIASVAWWQDSSIKFIQADRKHLETARQQVLHMAKDMQDTLRAIIQQTSWSRDTKSEAIRKLDAMQIIVGWPDQVPIVVTKQPNLDQSMPFDECILEGYRYQHKHIMENNGTPSDRRRWRWESSTIVNAFYSREGNVAYFPAALLYPPFLFREPENMLENYCAMGSILAHEMCHAFDYDSRYIDSQGLLRNWWAKEDERHYMENVRKTILLYQKHQQGSSRNTLSENIADLMGLRLVWQTFLMRWKFHHDREPTEEEAHKFFRVYVISQAQSYDASAEKEARTGDLHALGETRINVPLSTFPPFLELYRIRRSDPMYTPIENRPDFF